MKDEKVSLRWRMVFCWCPLAYYDIRKFWVSFVLIWGLSFVGAIPFVAAMDYLPKGEDYTLVANAGLLISSALIVILPMLYFMRRWAMAWNKKMESYFVPDEYNR